MKWLVSILLLVNIAFFARQYYRHADPPPPPQEIVRPYDHVNRLLLLSEVDTDKLRLRNPPPPPPPVKPPPNVAASQPASVEEPEPPPVVAAAEEAQGVSESCYSIGPLKDDGPIDALRSWLVALGGNPALRVDERRELERYWLYFPPEESLEAAQKIVDRMGAQGIKDVIAVPKGDMANAISLGVFSQRESLERRLEELRGFGYEPVIMPRYRTEQASWFDVTFESGERLSPGELSDRFPNAELIETGCASPAEIARGRPDS